MSAESLDGLNEKSTEANDEHLLYGNVLHADPLGVTNRRIDRLSDDIASAQMFGGDTAAKEHELQGEIDMRDYLMSRDYKDKYNNIHDAESNRFKSLDNANHKEENLGRSYESMTINELIDKWAESEDNNDRTSSSNVQDELQERLFKIPTIAEDNTDRDNHGVTENHKMQFIDVMHREMMSRRKNTGSLEDTKDNQITEPEESELSETNTPVQEQVDDAAEVVAPIETTEKPIIETEEKLVDEIIVPTGDETEDVLNPLSYTHLDVEKSIDAAAGMEAERRMQRELKEGGRIKQFINKSIFGKGGSLLKETFIASYKNRAKIEIAEDYKKYNNGELSGERASYIESIITQFQEDIPEAVNEEAGEHREVHKNGELYDRTKAILEKFVKGEVDLDGFKTERDEMLRAYRAEFGNEILGKEGNNEIDNLVEIARAAASRYEHDKSLENVFKGFEIRTGEAHTGANSKEKYNVAEKAIAWMDRHKFGWMVSSPVAIIGATMAISLARKGSQSLISTAAITVGFAGTAGIWAGLAKNKELKKDRYLDAVDMAEGLVAEQGDKKRNGLIDKRYDYVSATQATEQLKSAISENTLAEGGSNAISDALILLAAVEARVKESAAREVDLFSFTNGNSIVKERLELARVRNEAKKLLSDSLTPEMRNSLGISETESFDVLLKERVDVFTTETLDTDIEAKDKAFNKWKAKQVLVAGTTTMLVSGAMGLAFQEIKSIFDPNLTGVGERVLGTHDTTIEGAQHFTLLGGIGAKEAVTQIGPSGKTISEAFGSKGEATIPEGYHLIDNGAGKINFVDDGGNSVISDLTLDSDGSLSNESIVLLEKAGMKVDETKSFWQFDQHSHTENVQIDEYVNDHPETFKDIERAGWKDNKTSGIYEKNELQTDYAGEHSSGVTANGDVQYTVKHMTSDGSYDEHGSVDAPQEIKNGNLYAVVTSSASKVGQQHGIIIPIDQSGNINIPKDSPAFDLFTVENGKIKSFNGGFIEIFSKTDTAGVDGIRGTILSTVSGEHSIEYVPVETIDYTNTFIPRLEITPPTIEVVTPNFYEIPPIIPIDFRESMQEAKSRPSSVETPIDIEYGYHGSRELGEREVEERRKETSPRLRDNPDADLVPAEEFAFYKDLLVEKRGQEYVNEINDIVSKTPELNNFNSETKMIVMIPINAAGKSESENIYDVLTAGYGSQDPAGLKSTEILLHVNWFDSYDKDESIMRANISKTKSEIQRAKDDLADRGVNVAVIETEYKRSEVNGGVIGYVARKMNDIALLALDSAASAGRIDRNHDVLLIRNDADAIGIRRHYLKRYKDEFDSNRETDIFMGTTSFDQTKADRVPGFVFSGNFMQSFDIIANSREGRVHTGGANFGVRASTLAAVGGLGFGDYTGAGSDDVEIGRRVNYGRNNKLSTGDSSADTYVSDYQKDQSDPTIRSKRVVGKAVHGARIDTDSDRGEEMYIDGEGIINQWSKKKTGKSFSNNGYKPRNEGLVGNYSESLKRSPDEVVESVRRDFEATIRGMGSSSSVIRTALAFALPSSSYYELTNSGSKYDFKITPEGAKYLKKRLIPYGREKRQWYGDNGARKSTMIKI